jgi:hypothetical protein
MAVIVSARMMGTFLWTSYAFIRLGIAVGLAAVAELRSDEESVGELSMAVLSLRIPTMRMLSIAFSVLMVAVFVHTGVTGLEPRLGYLGREEVGEGELGPCSPRPAQSGVECRSLRWHR